MFAPLMFAGLHRYSPLLNILKGAKCTKKKEVIARDLNFCKTAGLNLFQFLTTIYFFSRLLAFIATNINILLNILIITLFVTDSNITCSPSSLWTIFCPV